MSYHSFSASPSSVAISIGEQRIKSLESRVKYLEMKTEESSDLLAGLHVHNEAHIESLSKLSDQLKDHQSQVTEKLDSVTSMMKKLIVGAKSRSSVVEKSIEPQKPAEELAVEPQKPAEELAVEPQKPAEVEKPVEELDPHVPSSCHKNFVQANFQDMLEASSIPEQHLPGSSIPVVDLVSSDDDPIPKSLNGQQRDKRSSVFTQKVPADAQSPPVSVFTQSLNQQVEAPKTSLQSQLPATTADSDVILFDNVDLCGCLPGGSMMNKLAVGCLHLKKRGRPIEIKFVAEDGNYEEYVVTKGPHSAQGQRNTYMWSCSVKHRETDEVRFATFGSNNEYSRFGQACNRDA